MTFDGRWYQETAEAHMEPWQSSYWMPYGIHCAARLIACFAVMEKANLDNQKEFYETELNVAFTRLLRSMSELGFSEAEDLMLGWRASLSDKQIEMTFNNLHEDHREGLEARAFSRPSVAAMNCREKRRIIKGGVCAIVGSGKLDRWITVEGRRHKGEYPTYDPKFPKKRRRAGIGLERGIFIRKQGQWQL